MYVAADGPRDGNLADHQGCEEVRDYLQKELNWEMDLNQRYQEVNLGCGKHVSSSISWFFEHEDEGIILEDDCVPSLSFFNFCTILLERYRHSENIQIIGGTNFLPTGNGESYYFSDFPQIWGWATWKRAWNNYSFSLKEFSEEEMKTIVNDRFSNLQMRDYWLDIFRMMKSEPVDTWDYQWTFSIWKANGICVIPSENLISNVGYGELATHTKDKNDLVFDRPVGDIVEWRHPQKIKVRKDLDKLLFYKNFEARKNAYFLKKVKDKLQWEVKKLLGFGKH